MPEQPSEAFKRVQPEEVSQSVDPELVAIREKMRKETEEKLAALRERENPSD